MRSEPAGDRKGMAGRFCFAASRREVKANAGHSSTSTVPSSSALAEKRRHTEDVEARKAKDDFGHRARAEKDFEGDPASPAHVDEVLRSAGGEGVEAR